MNAHQRRVARRAVARLRASRLSTAEIIRMAAHRFAVAMRFPFDMVTGDRLTGGCS
jgi:hypothetical protein